MRTPSMLLLLLTLAAPVSAQDVGERIASELRMHRSSSDTLLLDSITRPIVHYRDGAVVQAAIEIADDPVASTEARVMAIRALVLARRPNRIIRYSDLAFLRTDPRPCYGLPPALGSTYQEGTPPPPSWDSQVTTLAARLARDPAAPPEVRTAAVCLSRTELTSEAPAPHAPHELIILGGEGFSLRYVCGNRFMIRNHHDIEVPLVVKVVGTAEIQRVVVPPRPAGADAYELVITVTNVGTAQLWEDDLDDPELIAEAPNAGVPCPP